MEPFGERKLKITEQSKITCRMLNLLCASPHDTIEKDIETLIQQGAILSRPTLQNYPAGTECYTDEYDDFLTDPRYLDRPDFYPIVNAIYRHRSPAVIAVLYTHSKELPNFSNIMIAVRKELVNLFSQLYKNKFYSARAAREGTYHYTLKKLVDAYLCVLELDLSIFNDAPSHK